MKKVCVAQSSVEQDTVLRQTSVTEPGFYARRMICFALCPLLFTEVALINSGLYIPQSVSLSYMKVIHYGLRHEGVPERYFLSNISEGGGSTHGGEIFVRATRIQDGGTANTTADRIRPQLQCRLCQVELLYKAHNKVFFIHEHNPFTFRIYLEIF